ncbi:MAG: 2-hydroxyacyl-CoA dehydratase [Deltaproteobacteria bacterium]|nr:2-hydroxyacyl-CoA dehydratase [Deltaproteobacteria bacterium]
MKNSDVSKIVEENFGDGAIERAQSKWKAEGGRKIGWLCTYVPEEIIHAAGFLPVRITGTISGGARAEKAIYSNVCPFIKNCLSSALEDKYAFDGIVAAQTCDGITKLLNMWEYFKPIPFSHLVGLPRHLDEDGEKLFVYEVKLFKENLENTFDITITDESIEEAIRIYNETRKLLRELYATRINDTPKITGTDILKIMTAAVSMPKTTFNALLKELLSNLESLQGAVSDYSDSIRLIITGGEMDRPYLVDTLEGSGAIVVNEEMCMGYRYFGLDDDVINQDEPITDIARRYFYRMPCSAIYSKMETKMESLFKMIKDFKADAVVYHTLKFCDCYQCDYPIYEEEFRKRDIPLLLLETDYSERSVGQLRTRVEAFIEMLSEEV